MWRLWKGAVRGGLTVLVKYSTILKQWRVFCHQNKSDLFISCQLVPRYYCHQIA